MFRSVTITHPVVVNDGKPFEANGAREVPSNGMGFCLLTSTYEITFIPVDSIEKLEGTRASITFQLAQALNQPIKVTKKVLDAMEKVPSANYLIQETLDCPFIEKSNGRPVNKNLLGRYIQADCPLALQVLLGFTVEGVPVNE
jgi:hypothetical protein